MSAEEYFMMESFNNSIWNPLPKKVIGKFENEITDQRDPNVSRARFSIVAPQPATDYAPKHFTTRLGAYEQARDTGYFKCEEYSVKRLTKEQAMNDAFVMNI
jgi:hypothetical protein